MEAMQFDLAVIEIPVTITKKDKTTKECLLREASEDTAVKFQNARTACMSYGSEGNISGLKNTGDVEPMLVALCMVELVRGEDKSVINERPIQLTEVLSWPSRVVKPLFDKAKEISDIGDDTRESLMKQREAIDEQLKALDEKEATVKNDEKATTLTSD